MPLVAGVDSSTSACKVEVRDVDSGQLVAAGRAPHPPTTPPCSEQDPRAWWTAFEAAGDHARLWDRNRPLAISVAAQQHGLVVIDDGGQPLRPAKLWNDTESAAESVELIAALGPEEWAAACGSVPLPAFTITKLLWLKRREPDVFRRIASVLLPHDWLTRQLTGANTTDRGDASGTGWWSPAEERYRYDLLDLVEPGVDWDPLLPEVLGPDGTAGTWAETGIVVAPGTGDNMAAALGLALAPGELALSLGTSGTAFAVSEQPTADPTGAVAGFADATGRYLPLVCTLNATKVTETFARLLGVDGPGLDALALSCPPGAGGLSLIPYLDGERTPNRPLATGSLTGLRSDAARHQVARAAFEGVVCNMLDAADRLPGALSGKTVVLLGGGAHSPAYQQVLADLVGREIRVAESDELVARGAAIQAASVLTGRRFADLVADWGPASMTIVQPSGSADADEIRDRYRQLIAGLTDERITERL